MTEYRTRCPVNIAFINLDNNLDMFVQIMAIIMVLKMNLDKSLDKVVQIMAIIMVLKMNLEKIKQEIQLARKVKISTINLM